jgi:hypothetical protein
VNSEPDEPTSGVRLLSLWLVSVSGPAAIIGWLILRNHVDMPFWDDWLASSDILIKAKTGALTVHDIVTQLNESRLVVPRLLFLGIALLTDGRVAWQLLLTFLLAVFISWASFLLILRTVGSKRLSLLGLAFLVNLLIFTPMHGENWLWGAQVICFIPVACLLGTLLVLDSGMGDTARIAVGGLLCTVATYSYANGLVTWVAAAPAVFVVLGARPLAAWAGLFALNLGSFFYGYTAPGGQMLEGVRHPIRAGEYVLAFLGAPLAVGRLRLAQAVGAALLVVSLCVAVFLWHERRDATLRRRTVPWVSLVLYVLASAALAAAGRSAFGVEQALARRYVSFSIYLLVALVLLVAIVAADAKEKSRFSRRGKSWFRLTRAGLVAGLLVLHFVCFVSGAHGIVWVGRMLRYGKSCLVFANAAPDTACLTSWVLPNAETATRMVNDLDRLGCFRPHLVRSPRLQDLQPAVDPASIGVFEGLGAAGGKLTASGWAVLPGGSRAADSVILAQEALDGSWIPIGFWPVLGARPDVAEERGRSLRESGWAYTFDASRLERRPVRVSAWSFDCERGEAYQLANVVTVER